MDTYMENQLTALHNAGVKSRFLEKVIAFVTGLLVLTLLPYIHLGQSILHLTCSLLKMIND